MPHFDVHIKSEFFEHFYKWWRFERCRQRVLVVTDGLNFSAADGFGLTVFLGELAKAYPTPSSRRSFTTRRWARSSSMTGR